MVKKILLIMPIILAIQIVSAVQIATDDFECNGFSCGSGWNSAWSTSGDCVVTDIGIPRGAFHMRGQEDASGSCIADRNFDNSAYNLANVSFWAKADVLEDGDFCRYYYFNGAGYTQLLEIANGGDDNIYRQYNYSVEQYGLSLNAGIRVRQFGVGSDNCYIEDIAILGTTMDTTPPLITINFPLNTTINDSTPNLNITINEANIDSVWISLDNGQNITYAHKNGTIDFGYLDLIFADDFHNYIEGSNGGPTWTNPSALGKAVIENKAYKLYNETPLDDALSYITSFNQVDYEAFAKVMVPNSTFGGAYLTPRFNDVNNKYEIAIDYDFSSININKVVNGTWTNLSSKWTGDLTSPIYVNKEEWHTLGLKVKNNNIASYIDGQLATNVIDNSLNYTGFAIIAFDDVKNHTAYFDDVAISKELSDGSHTLRVYANDTFGNLNYTAITFSILTDEIFPLISIIHPQNTSYNTASLQINFSVSDTNLNSCWYTDNSGQANTTLSNCQNTSYTASQGSTILKIYANDSAGNTNSSSVTFFVDSLKPNINIIFPSNSQWFNSKNIEINNSILDTNLQSCWWTNNSGITNNSITCGANITNQQWNEGQNTISIYANDSLNNNNFSTIIFYIDTIAPLLIINNPNNQSYNNASLLINITSNGNYTWFFNGTANETYSSLVTRTFFQGNNTIYAYSNDSLNNINTSKVAFFIDSIPPSLTMSHPESKAYGTNTSLPLNFAISDTYLQTCWYNLNNEINISLPNCQNTTFNASTDGNYNLSLFANDFLGNTANSSISFSIITTAPAINLIYPKDSLFLNYAQNIQLNYSVISEIAISECQLWGDFSGIWQLNQTNNTISLENNFFVLNLQEENYQWGILCNDTQNRVNNVNSTFSIDITLPQISLAEPKGTKTSRENILLIFSALDNNLQACSYNVYEGIVQRIQNTTVNCYQTALFNLTSDANFILNLYVNDSAGNMNFSSAIFKVDTSTPSPPAGGGGGGGGGGFPSAKRNSSVTAKISFSEPKNLVIKRGTSTTAEIEITNEERIFLNDCKLVISGPQASWFSNEQSKGLSPGEKFKFTLNIKIPEEAEPGDYSQEITVGCNEGKKSTNIFLTIFRNNFETKIINYERTVDTLQISYSIREFAQKNHDIVLKYNLLNLDEITVVDGQESISLKPGEEKSALLEFKIPKDISGEFALKMRLNDTETSNDVAQQIVLQSKSILGLAISNSNRRTLSIFGVIFLSSITLFFVSRFIYKSYKQHKINEFVKGIEEKHGKKLIKLNVKHTHN